MSKALKVLVIGYGNPAREDDGLGPAAAEQIEALEIPGVTVDSDYQLTVEDAAAAAQSDTVVFIDAAAEGAEPFAFSRLAPRRQDGFSSHSVQPETVIALAQELFDVEPRAYLLAIRGYSFSMFKEEMSEVALKNLERALDFIVPVLRSKSFAPEVQ